MFRQKACYFLPVVIVTSLILNCRSYIKMIPEPINEKNLLIGSVILEVNGYKNNFISIWDDIEVAIVGEYTEDGKLKSFGQWTVTDENGYFFIANVPDGEYAIKAIKAYNINVGDISIMNHLDDPENNYFELYYDTHIGFGAQIFDTKPQKRIINMKHNIFKLYPNNIINLTKYDHIKDLKLTDGQIISSPPVPYYFNEKFPDNPWEYYLNMQY